MRNFIRVLSIAVVLSGAVSTQAIAQQVVQERTVAPFTSLSISGNSKVELSQGESQSVTIEASEQDQDQVTVENSSKEVLRIVTRGGNMAVVNVITPALTSIRITDNSSLSGKTPFASDNLKVEAAGASKVDMDLECRVLVAHLSGASAATIKGLTDSLNLKLSGASQGKFDSLLAVRAVVDLSGASSASVNVAEILEGKVSGASNIIVVNEPAVNALVISSIAAALMEGDETVSADIKVGHIMKEIKKQKPEKEKKFNGHFKGVELGINTYVNRDNEFKLPEDADFMALRMPNSLTVNLNLLEANLPIIKQNVGLVTGMGIEFNNYKFEQSNYLKKIDGRLVAEPADIEFIKSKLSCSYLKVPFMIEYQTNSGSKKSSFHIGGGANLGLRLRSHTKYKFDDGGRTVKEKEWDSFYLNPFRVAGIVKFGWGPLNFFAEYNLLPLFESGKGPELYPVSFGIALANWN